MKQQRRKLWLLALFGMMSVASAWADNVAKIGETEYESLALAFAEANEATKATTIVLIANTTETETITLNPTKAVTLDLAGFTLTSQLNTLSPLFKLTKGTLIIKDSGTTKGGITGTGIIFRIDSREESSVTTASKASVTVNSGVNVTSTDSPCAFIRGYATFTTNGNLTSSGVYATIQGNGSDTQGSVININGGIVKSNESNAVYHPQKGTLNVKNAAIVDGVSSGIAIKAGALYITGGTIKATGASNIPTSGWSNGVNASGCAIQIESNTDYDANGVLVSISGTPTIESTNGAAVYEYVGKGDATKLTQLKVTGGTFKAATDMDAILLSQQAAEANVTAVSGGSFSSVLPAAYCAEGYAPVTTQDENGLYTVAVTEESGVASITRDGKTTYYLTVTNALSAAQDGETVTMQKDYTSSALSSAAQLTAQKSITLDLNGHTIEHTNSKNALYVSGSSGKNPIIIVKNGTVKSNATAIKAGANAIVTIENDVTVIGNYGIEVGGGQTTLTTTGTITGTEAGIYIAGAGTSYSNKIVNVEGGTISGQYGIYSNQAATVNVSDGAISGTFAAIALNGYQAYSETSGYTIHLNVTGGTITGTSGGWAIAGSGNKGDGNYDINISDGTITSDDAAIYHCNDGVLTVSGGTITGTTAIYQKSGTLNITGGTINGTGAAADYTHNGNGANATGDAVVVDNCGYPGGAPEPNITGGTFNSTNADPIASYVKQDDPAQSSATEEPVTGFVSGGNFNKQLPADVIAADKICPSEANETDGTFSLTTGSYAATVGDYGYEDFGKAVAAITAEDDIIVLLADVNSDFTLAEGKTLKVKKGTFNLTVVTPTEGDYFLETAEADGITTYTVTAAENKDYDIAEGENYNLTKDVTVKSATYTRTFGSERVEKYQAWFIPFDYTITTEDISNIDFFSIHMIAHAPAEGEQEDPNKIWIFLNAMNSGDKLTANTPYVIKPKKELTDYEFTTSSATLKAVDATERLSCSTTSDDYKFYGTYSSVKATTEEPFYYVNIKGQISRGTTVTVGPHRWIMKTTAKVLPIGFIEIDDQTTAIQTIHNKDAEVEGYYTLDGVSVQLPVKGIYVVKYANGTTKKITVK